MALDPLALAIEEPSTEKGAALPAHPGSAAYIDDEEESFLDRYSDFFYLGAMLIGVLASGATAIFSRLNAEGTRAVDRLTARLIEILKVVRFAPSLDMMNGLETETDEIVAAALDQSTARSLDERRLGALGLALHQVREAIRDRRAVLSGSERATSDPGRTPVTTRIRDGLTTERRNRHTRPHGCCRTRRLPAAEGPRADGARLRAVFRAGRDR